jgi:hypothetical protein
MRETDKFGCHGRSQQQRAASNVGAPCRQHRRVISRAANAKDKKNGTGECQGAANVSKDSVSRHSRHRVERVGRGSSAAETISEARRLIPGGRIRRTLPPTARHEAA